VLLPNLRAVQCVRCPLEEQSSNTNSTAAKVSIRDESSARISFIVPRRARPASVLFSIPSLVLAYDA
jgi:hypothetical protein